MYAPQSELVSILDSFSDKSGGILKTSVLWGDDDDYPTESERAFKLNASIIFDDHKPIDDFIKALPEKISPLGASIASCRKIGTEIDLSINFWDGPYDCEPSFLRGEI